MKVLFVLTEHVGHLNAERQRRYARAARLLEELAGVPPRVVHYADRDAFRDSNAIVLSGSDAPWPDHDEAELERLRDFAAGCGRPVLGICAGMQLLAQCAGGAVGHARESERGFLPIQLAEGEIAAGDGLFHGLPERVTVYQSHTDEITRLPEAFRVLASSPQSHIQAIAADSLGFWGTQFHPERATNEHPAGRVVLENFFALARAR
ncbi:MAG: gamma-glutamyl-gamma-aminobutyrate hydrolase family protein [Gaiellaceae bacterium MAG52_C11]|nr:gamma-glutamyl-gamma-aminobutyrate hydrolase family protein [Candidatus Gaiellasilicea maunaloa]